MGGRFRTLLAASIAAVLGLSAIVLLIPRATITLAAPDAVTATVSLPAAAVRAEATARRAVEPSGRSVAARAEGSVIFFCCRRTCNEPLGCSEREEEAPPGVIPAGTVVGSCSRHATKDERRCLAAGGVRYRTTAPAQISRTRERCGVPVLLIFTVAMECHLRSASIPIVALEPGDDANHGGEHYVEYSGVTRVDGVDVFVANIDPITGGRDAGVPMVRAADVVAARRSARIGARRELADRIERAAAREGYDGTVLLDRDVNIRDERARRAVGCYRCGMPSVGARAEGRAAAFSTRALEDRARITFSALLPDRHEIVEETLRMAAPVLRGGRVHATVTADVRIVGVEAGPALVRGKDPAAAAAALAESYGIDVVVIRRTFGILSFLPVLAGRIDIIVEPA